MPADEVRQPENFTLIAFPAMGFLRIACYLFLFFCKKFLTTFKEKSKMVTKKMAAFLAGIDLLAERCSTGDAV
jgi:hypothetical protein